MSLTQGLSDQAVTSPPGLVWCRSSIRAGGKDTLGSISKQGDRYLRSLFVAGALSVIRYAKAHGTKHRPWLTAWLARRPTKVTAIALANKVARMAWAMMAKGERYRNPVALAA
jgi:transposase